VQIVAGVLVIAVVVAVAAWLVIREAGRIAKEPPPADHPLLQFDNVLASPHTAGVTREARMNMGKIAAEQILDALDGKRPPRIVNPEVWPAYAKRFEQTFGFTPEG